MTDLVLPAAANIETYIDETVSVLSELLEDTPAEVLAGFDFKAQGEWAFARPGAPPLKASESLDDAGVVDGALLTRRAADGDRDGCLRSQAVLDQRVFFLDDALDEG